MRFHHVAVRIADVIGIPIRVRDAQQRTLRRPDADGENLQTGLRRVLRGGERGGFVVVVLAVGEQHQHLVTVAFLERLQRRVRWLRRAPCRPPEWCSRPAPARSVRTPCCQSSAGIPETRRRRTPRDRAGRLRLLHQFQRAKLGALEPVGRDVLGQHAFGSVNRPP